MFSLSHSFLLLLFKRFFAHRKGEFVSDNPGSGSKEKQDQCHNYTKVHSYSTSHFQTFLLLDKIKSFSEFLFFQQRKYITVLEYLAHPTILK